MKSTINCKGKILNLQKKAVCGILNVTPDSFYDGGKYTTEQQIKARIEQIFAKGADFIDIGAYSSRPGAENISENEELRRIMPALKIMSEQFPEKIFSVDTFRSEIARIAVADFGAAIINDISGGSLDPKMFETVGKSGVPYILMHIKGTPQNMQINPIYEDIFKETAMYFSEKIKIAKDFGINDIIVDPGFGFGKTLEQNYILLKNLRKYKIFDLPVLVGLSRKSMIYKSLGITPEQSLSATNALNMTALLNGADILRVHDVKQAAELIKLNELLNN